MQITPCEAFKKELLFAVRVWQMRKPVCSAPSEHSSVESNESNNDKIDGFRLNSVKNVKLNGINGF